MYEEVEIILSYNFLSAVPVLLHVLYIDDNISLSQAQASASQFYTWAHSMYMYQEVEIVLSDAACILYSPSIVPYFVHI